LNPNSPDVVFELAMFAWITGDTARSLSLADRLIQIDPLSPLAARVKAEALQWGGRQAEALEQDKVATKLDPTVLIVESTKGNALRELGRLDESVQAFLDFERLFDTPSWGLAITYGRMGKRDEALQIIHALEERAKRQWVEPTFVAMAYAGIGDRDHAMEWVERAVQMKSYTVRALMNWDNPWLRLLRDDPRYVALRRKALATTFKS
jgi:tetratricopeptide (TPR) repeat protein